MHPLQNSRAQYLFLAKIMALDGRTQGDRKQNNAKHSNMYDCILELCPANSLVLKTKEVTPLSSQVWNFLFYFVRSDALQNWKWESLAAGFICLK